MGVVWPKRIWSGIQSTRQPVQKLTIAMELGTGTVDAFVRSATPADRFSLKEATIATIARQILSGLN